MVRQVRAVGLREVTLSMEREISRIDAGVRREHHNRRVVTAEPWLREQRRVDLVLRVPAVRCVEGIDVPLIAGRDERWRGRDLEPRVHGHIFDHVSDDDICPVGRGPFTSDECSAYPAADQDAAPHLHHRDDVPAALDHPARRLQDRSCFPDCTASVWAAARSSEIVWFGATGGVLAGLGGVFFHNADWNRTYDYWHYSRPFVGGVVGGIGCLLFYVSILIGNTKSVTPNVVTFDAVAFILGFADEAFRGLITKLTQLLFGPGDTKPGAAGSGNHQSP